MRTILARAFSLLGYPYIIIPVAIALAAFAGAAPSSAVIEGLGVLLLVFGVVAIRTWRGVRSGALTNFDVSQREQRASWYPFLLSAMTLATVCLWWFRPEHPALRGVGTATAMLATTFALNRWLKVSLHAACGFFAAAIPLRVAPLTTAALAVFAIGICWSRLELKRHTLAEVIVGALVGVAAGAVFTF